jgi:tetratricopeptide (TPR) repeat protein
MKSGNGRQKAIIGAVILAALLLQIPVQTSIDRYRNTFRVVMYADARDQDVEAVKDKLAELGLAPRVVTVTGSDGLKAKQIVAEMPRKLWNSTFEKYVTAVHNIPGSVRVANVIAGLNEQGIPLDQIQQLNIQDAGIIVVAALIGGFRKSASNVLWLQNEDNWHSGKGYRTLPLARAVTLLDPTFVDAWTLTCWHLAYNMSVEAKTPDEAASLIKSGLDFAKAGIPWNSTHYEIYQEIGWTYYDKLQNYAMAAEYLKKAIEHPHPTYLERLIAHAYERIPDFDNALRWYNVSLQKYGEDHVADGAKSTITERYLNAWHIYLKGDMDAAEAQLEKDWGASLERLDATKSPHPSNTIYLHFKARLAEGRAEQATDPTVRAQLWRKAFEVWMEAGKYNATDRLARRRVLTLAANNGWMTEVPKGWNDVGVPDTWAKDLQPDRKPFTPQPKKADDKGATKD